MQKIIGNFQPYGLHSSIRKKDAICATQMHLRPIIHADKLVLEKTQKRQLKTQHVLLSRNSLGANYAEI